MRRRNARSGGEAVAALALQLSGDLLVAETRCFREIEALFADRVNQIAGLAVRVPWTVGSYELQKACQPVVIAGANASLDSVKRMLEMSAELSVSSVRKELRICETVVGDRYVGVADRGADHAASKAQVMIEAGVEQYRLDLPKVVDGFLRDVSEQQMLSNANDETKDQLAQRLVSLEPVRLKGRSGKGVVWGTVSYLELMARAVSIDMSNSLRVMAIDGMNKAARGR